MGKSHFDLFSIKWPAQFYDSLLSARIVRNKAAEKAKRYDSLETDGSSLPVDELETGSNSDSLQRGGPYTINGILGINCGPAPETSSSHSPTESLKRKVEHTSIQGTSPAYSVALR